MYNTNVLPSVGETHTHTHLSSSVRAHQTYPFSRGDTEGSVLENNLGEG